MKTLLLKWSILIGVCFYSIVLSANEGFWLPNQIQGKLYRLMKSEGLKLSASDIYEMNQACLSQSMLSLSYEDATFSPFASASFVSGNGLVLTNYHCVMRYLEQLATPENDYIKHGCWTTSQEQEAPLFNLQVNQLVNVQDITSEILQGTEGLSSSELSKQINANSQAIQKNQKKGKGIQTKVYSIFGGQQYIMLTMRSFKDVRIVAAPPMSIGKFGGDTDNWQWPRYAADFAFLRVYADEENRPASHYRKENRPYKTESFLKVSAKGVKEDDFVMVAGFPAKTLQYIPSFALEKIISRELQADNELTGSKLNFYRSRKEQSKGQKYSYYNVLAGSTANVYLRNQGCISGVNESNLIAIKKEEERALTEWIRADEERVKKYGYDLLKDMEENYEKLSVLNFTKLMFEKVALNSIGVIPFAGKFEKLIGMYRQTKREMKGAKRNEIKRLSDLSVSFYGSFDIEDDKELMKRLLPLYIEKVDTAFFSDALKETALRKGNALNLYIDSLYENSLLRDNERIQAFLKRVPEKGVTEMAEDPLYQLALGFYYVHVSKVALIQQKFQNINMEYYSLYLKALKEKEGDKLMASDANRTPRFSYGKVCSSQPAEGILYTPFSTLSGLVERKRMYTGTPDFVLPASFWQLVQKETEGSGKDKALPCTFLADAHTTAGNSGSPVLNAKGELVGINFDRTWQGLVSDYRFNAQKSRNIVIDIRYILWIIKNYSGSKHLLDELNIRY